MSANISAQTNANCNGSSDGTATVSATGGTGTYTFSWSDGQTNATATGLSAAIYTVTVSDGNSCVSSASATITEPSDVVSATTSSDESCSGNDGTATVAATGGTGLYTFLWSDGQTTTTATGLIANSYSVTVNDANGCTDINSVVVADGCVCSMAASALTDNNVSCNGGSDGQATVVQTLGTPTILFLWSDGQTNATATGLAAATYTVTVTDNNACTATASATITEPSAVVSATTSSDESCSGNDGIATVAATGGTGLYTFLWSDGQTTTTATGLIANSYSVTVNDANGCTDINSVVVADGCVCPMTASASADNNVSCNGGSDGQATAVQTLGDPLITFLWSDGQTNATAVGLAANAYTVTVTDNNGCTATASVTITEPSVLFSAATSNPESCAGNDGSAIGTASGGTGVYSFLWSDGQTNSTATGLTASSYGLTVTDANACTASTSVAVSDGCVCPMTASASVDNNVSCNSGADGQVTAVQTLGTPAITFLWSDGQTNATAVGLIAGIYTVTVTDQNSCVANAIVTVTEPAALISAATASGESCSGNDGTATGVATGGTGTYTFLWSDGQTSSTATGLTASSYGLTVTDASACSDTTSVMVNYICVCSMVASASVDNNVSCNGGSDGQISAVQTLGTAPVSYLWSDGQTNATATGLSANVYSVTVTDFNACTATASATITEPSVVAPVTTSSPESCTGNDGTATAAATGGTGSYTFLWSDGQTTVTATGLVANTYSVTVTDVNSCSASTTVTVANGCACSIIASASVDNNINCNGGSDGQATATQILGAAPVSFVWSDGQTNATATGLSANVYSVTVTDFNACTATASVTITQPVSVLSALVTGVSNPLCNNDSNGSLTVSAFGGSPGYSFDIGSGNQTSGTFGGLAGGVYTVTVTDANTCTITASTGLTNPSVVSVNANVASNVSCNGNTDGSATATAFGGSGGFSFIWNDGQTTNTATGLSAISYSVTATDVNGCLASASVTVTEPSAITASAAAGIAISCAGGVDGTANATGAGGTGSLTFAWNNGQTTATATGLAANSYTVTVSDQNACFDIASITISDPSGTVATASVTSNYNGADISCNGSSDGSALVSATGGTGSYTFLWTPGGLTTASVSGLNANVYTVLVTDANSCVTQTSVTLTEPSAVVSTAFVNSAVLCAGGADGTASAAGTGGTGTLTYVWSNGESSQNASALSAQSYTVSVTDQNGCSDISSVTLTEPSAVSATAADNGDGTTTATATGGVGSFTFLWDAAAGNQTTATATGLVHNNTYTVTVTDANGCTATASVTVNITGLDNIPDLSRFVVMPNPNTGEFYIQVNFTESKNATVRLSNVLGQILKEYHYSESEFNVPVDVQHQASGVYFVELQTGSSSVTRKVIIAKQ